MTSPAGADYSLSVDIIPDASNFGNRLRAALKNLPPVDVRVDPDTAGFNTRLRAALRALPPVLHNVRLDVNTTGFNTRLRAALRTLAVVEHRVNVTPNTAGFNATLRAALAALPKLSAQVDANPSIVGFQTRLRAALATLPPVYADVQLSPDVTGFVARLNAAVAAATPTPTVKVRVDPDLTGFNQRLRAAVAAMGTPPTIRVRIEPDLTGFGGTVASSARAGQLAGGAYAATFRNVVQNALRNLPEPTIGVATGPFDQGMRELRASLERLGNERVGVTITTGQAQTEIRNLRADIARLQAMSPIDVDAEANLRAAMLELARMESALNAIGRDRTTNVRIRTDHSQLNALQTALLGSTSRIQLLITAGLAIGPAIVPAAAAAAAAVAAIGGAAISAGAGLGVGILAISGVVGAVKALNDARNDAAKTQATLARQDKQEASGADQVRNAIASLANTRAQAASQARQSANQIADAERGLASAQRDALRAQQDITRAREEAQDALEDLDSAIANNALSIRQANLDLADAKANLDKVMSDPTATRRQREEAQLTYDRAKQQIDDLTTRQGRYAEEKADADRRGIEGSQQVVAAQERAKDAQERVAEAERNLAEARISAAEQQRQAAFSIAQAQQAIIAAQRNMATSAASAAATGGAAMDTLREKMAGLSPEAQRFAQYLFRLQPELVGLRQSAEQALPGFQRGIDAILPALPAVNDFVRRVALSLGEMGENAGAALNSARFRPFFSYIDATAVPTMEELADSAGNVAAGLGNIVVAFGPMQRQLTGGLVDITEKFERWSSTLGSNNNFQRFLDYAITRGPIVLDVLSDVGGAVIHILEASAPAGDAVLAILSAISAVIEAIPVPVLATLLGVMTSLRIASLLAAIPLGRLGATVSTLPGRFVAMTTSMGAARAGLAAFAATLGGPVTIAIAAATFGIGYLISRSAEQRAEIDRLKTSLDSYGSALKGGITRESLANAQAILQQESALRGLVDAVETAGLSQQTLVAGLNGDRDARNQVIAALNAQIAEEEHLQALARGSADHETVASAAHKKRAEELEKLRIAFAKTSGANAEAAELAAALAAEDRNLADAITAVKTALETSGASADQFGTAINLVGDIAADAAGKADVFALIAAKVAGSNLDAADKAKLFGQILGQLGSAATTQGATFDALAGTFNNIADSSLNANDKVQLLRRSLEQMYGSAIAQTEATEGLIRAKLGLSDQLARNSAGFDLNRVSGDANTKAVLDNRDALQAALEKLREKYLQDIANGLSQDQARAAHERNKNEILAGIPPTQRSTQAVQDLVNVYGALPTKKTTEVTTPGLDKAIDALVEAHAIQRGIAEGWTKDRIAAEAKLLKASVFGGYAGNPAAFKADGGLIEGWSPHSRADNIPAWLTANEYVQPVDTVRYYGVGFMEALRRKQIPREAIHGYATGGLVRVGEKWPIEVPVSVKMPKTVDQLWAEWQAAQYYGTNDPGNVGPGPGFPPWPSSPSRQRGDSGVWKSILNMVRAAGIPYRFGNSYRHGDPLWHGSGRAIDFMGYNQDALAQFFMGMQGRVLELIHWSTTTGRKYGITRGRIRDFPTQFPLHRNHVHIAMADGGLVPNIGMPAIDVGSSLAQALNVPHLVRDEGGWVPPGLSLIDNRTRDYEWMYNAQQNEALIGAAARGVNTDSSDRRRGGDVHIDTFVAESAQSPHDIARELDWLGRHGG